MQVKDVVTVDEHDLAAFGGVKVIASRLRDLAARRQ